MGGSASKRVQETLRNSAEFNSACHSVYSNCLSLTQHAFNGVKPYQLLSATVHLHRTLSLSPSLQLISKWVPHPPSREQVDRAFKKTIRSGSNNNPVHEEKEEMLLDDVAFKLFAVEVFADGVVSGAGREVLLKRVPLGAVGIAGVGAVVRPGNGVVAAAIGAYALGVAASVYLGLSG